MICLIIHLIILIVYCNNTEENGTWEIDEGFQIPMSFNVTVNFVYIGKYLPTTLGKHYEVPHLVDKIQGLVHLMGIQENPTDLS